MSYLADLKSRFLDTENFYLAFKKLKYYLEQGNEWYDPVNLNTYDANLNTNIRSLIERLKEETYQTHPLQLLPFPKKADDKGSKRIRQYFDIHLEDQLVWLALTNIIGKFAEERMPFWSYGNRLFRPVWSETKDGVQRFVKGSYTSSSVQTYRKWTQSWPFYRRHIVLTAKIMSAARDFEVDTLDKKERSIYKEQEVSKENNYLSKEFWSGKGGSQLLWATLDFKDFFPSIRPEVILSNIEKVLVKDDGTPRDDTSLILSLAKKMLTFKLNPLSWSNEELELVSLDKNKIFTGIPTGLLVGGFLANVAMLEIDGELHKYLLENRDVAVFKYVDDHTILATSEHAMLHFLNFYHRLLKKKNTGAEFKREKVEPLNVLTYDEETGFTIGDNPDKMHLDPDFPTPLMTTTLEKMSHLNETDLDIAGSAELEKSKNELIHFLLADLPDSEMKRETRMAFAATKFCQVGKKLRPDFSKVGAEMFPVNGQKKEEQLNRFLVAAKETIQVQHSHIFKLLLKAATENPDKLKLWKRCFEYCYYAGHVSPMEVFDAIDECALHEKSRKYLYAHGLITLSLLGIKALNNLSSNNLMYWETEVSKGFLRNLLVVTVPQKSKILFELVSNELFIVVRRFISRVFRRIVNKEKFRSTENSMALLRHTTSKYTYAEYLWFFLMHSSEPLKVKIWDENVINLRFKEKISWSIVSLYPSKISVDLFKNMQNGTRSRMMVLEKRLFTLDGSAILYDIFKASPEIYHRFSAKFPLLKRICQPDETRFITLDRWLETVRAGTQSEPWLDPRLSEWTFLEIVSQIIDAVTAGAKTKSKSSIRDLFVPKKHLRNVHPNNFIIPRSWLSTNRGTWKQWKAATRENKIKLNAKTRFILDHRFVPYTHFWQTSTYAHIFGNGEFVMIISLCVLLTKLIDGSFEWPPSHNKMSFLDDFYGRTLRLLEEQPVSSSTRTLISTIFSKRDISFWHDNKTISLEKGIELKTLADFKKCIITIQGELELNHLDLYNQMPRQLTVIDLDQLNASKIIF